MILFYNDEYFMCQVLQEVRKVYDLGEIFVGVVVVVKQQVIVCVYNFIECLYDVMVYVEIQVIMVVVEFIGGKYFKGCMLYVMFEFCVMCVGVLYWLQIDKIVFVCEDEKCGVGWFGNDLYYFKIIVSKGLLQVESCELMFEFFCDKCFKFGC